MIEALKQKLGDEVEKLQYELNVTLPSEIADLDPAGSRRTRAWFVLPCDAPYRVTF